MRESEGVDFAECEPDNSKVTERVLLELRESELELERLPLDNTVAVADELRVKLSDAVEDCEMVLVCDVDAVTEVDRVLLSDAVVE